MLLNQHFNSTMVRLKAQLALQKAEKDYKFQFHYGTIKRDDTPDNIAGMPVFQFHYGTIKR